MSNQKRLFWGSCFALITTALSFSLRAGVLDQLGDSLQISDTNIGFINSMWFAGFPIAMIIGGLVYHTVGGKRIMEVAFLSHTLGILLTIVAGLMPENAFTILLVSTLLIGLGNGCTEAACNPMIADAYEGNMMSKMMNRFHMWFPGGIVIGSLLSAGMTAIELSWVIQLTVIILPAIAYALLFRGQEWPSPKTQEATSLSGNLKAMISPLFIFMFLAMAITAITEFGPNQWVKLTLKESGASPMIILALVSGLMAIARYFGGDVVKQFNTTGVLLGSAILATIGIYMFSTQTGTMAYVAAILFGLGIAYFWPNMLGFIADYIPESGAIGLSVVGAMGMFSTAIFNPIIGGWIDANEKVGIANGLEGSALELFKGQETLSTMILFPSILLVAFTVLYFWMKKRNQEVVAA